MLSTTSACSPPAHQTFELPVHLISTVFESVVDSDVSRHGSILHNTGIGHSLSLIAIAVGLSLASEIIPNFIFAGGIIFWRFPSACCNHFQAGSVFS